MKDRRTCFAQGLDNDSSWNDYLKIRKELKQKIMEKIIIITKITEKRRFVGRN